METISEVLAIFTLFLIGGVCVIGVFALGAWIGKLESAEAHQWLWRLVIDQADAINELSRRLQISVEKANEARAQVWRDREDAADAEEEEQIIH